MISVVFFLSSIFGLAAEPGYVSTLTDVIKKLSQNPNIRTEFVEGKDAKEFRVYVPESAKEQLNGPAGITQHAIVTLANEFDIFAERTKSAQLGQMFELKSRKPLYVRFIEIP